MLMTPVTQSCDISSQLKLGIRAFDIRPVIISTLDDAASADPNVYSTCHFDNAPAVGWEGCTGQTCW